MTCPLRSRILAATSPREVPKFVPPIPRKVVRLLLGVRLNFVAILCERRFT